MPGLSQLAGVGPVIEFGDRHVQVVGRRLRHLCEIETQIQWIRGDPVSHARNLLACIEDRNVRVEVSEQLVRTIRHKFSGVTCSTLGKWLSSFEGRLFAVWQSVRDSDVSYDDSLRICCDSIDKYGLQWLERIEWAIDLASNHAEHQQIIEIANIRAGGKGGSGDGFYNYDSFIRSLCREPFNLDPNSVFDLTLYQITVIARPPEESMTDERDVEVSQTKHLSSGEVKVIWGNRYGPLAENLADGNHIMNGLRN